MHFRFESVDFSHVWSQNPRNLCLGYDMLAACLIQLSGRTESYRWGKRLRLAIATKSDRVSDGWLDHNVGIIPILTFSAVCKQVLHGDGIFLAQNDARSR